MHTMVTKKLDLRWTGHPALSSTHQVRTVRFCWSKVLQIREKMLEFSSVVLPKLPPFHHVSAPCICEQTSISTSFTPLLFHAVR